MKIILTGYDESKRILGPASWLANKYIPKDFEIIWLNYGDYTGNLHCGKYVSLDVMQFGGSLSWSNYVLDFIKGLDDEYIILAVDDYFVSQPMNMKIYNTILNGLGGKRVSGRLWNESSSCKYEAIENKDYLLAVDDYPSTLQFCIWNRKVAMEILELVSSPWQFEIKGSRYMIDDMKYETIGTIEPALIYNSHSVLSPKWEGLRYKNLDPKDFRELRNYGYL